MIYFEPTTTGDTYSTVYSAIVKEPTWNGWDVGLKYALGNVGG